MKSHVNRTARRTAAVIAVAAMLATMFTGSAVGQPGQAPPETKQAPSYIDDLGHPNPRVREKAADMLAMIGLEIKDETTLLSAVARLVALMDDADVEVRDESAEALGVIGSRVKDEVAVQWAISALTRTLSDNSGEVREEAAEALARIASSIKNKALLEPAVEPLRKTLAGNAAETREFARSALESLGKAATAATKTMTLSAKDAQRERYLLLDSRIIESKENVELTVGVVQKDENNPLFREDKPWEPRFDNPYSSIVFDEEEKIYKCWYSIFTRSGGRGDFPGEGLPSEKRARVDWREGVRGFGLCYATSKDGIHWEKPELGLIDFGGSKQNNIVIEYSHGVAVIKDRHETDPQKLYKAIHPERNNSAVWFSADGIHWSEKLNAGSIDHGDTNQSVWWDPDVGKYVLITRRWGGANTTGRYGRNGHRQVVRSTSDDFLNWSKTELVTEGLDLRMQIHDMLVVRHAGVYLGMVGLFDIEASRQWCELAWSPDSIEWHRIQPGVPLIPNGPVMGDYDWGCIFTSTPMIRKDGILLYYGANDGRFMAWRNGFLCLARLRPDGFAGYEQIAGGSNKTGSLTTRPISVVAGSLCISADVAPSGYVKVTVLDEDNNAVTEGELVTTTVSDAEVKWKEGFSLDELKGKEVNLRFELRESKIYSFSFSTDRSGE